MELSVKFYSKISQKGMNKILLLSLVPLGLSGFIRPLNLENEMSDLIACPDLSVELTEGNILSL